MCQLMFVHLGSEVFNKNYLIIQSYLDSLTDNKDGFGYFTPGNLQKTIVAPSDCTNLGTFISKISSSPILAHVRKATATNNVKTISVEKSHPFETDTLILAHNGVLELKDTSKYYKEDFGTRIDSEIFLEILTREYGKGGNKSFSTILTHTYADNFYGKFAFLIYDKIRDDFYVVRGDTAKLNIKYFLIKNKPFGFVVNTNKDDLINASLLFHNLMLAKGVELAWTDTIEELSQNTIFKLDKKKDKLIDVGKITETRKPPPVVVTTYSNGWVSRYEKTKTDKGDPLINDISEMCKDWNMSIQYLDLLLFCTLGKPLLECHRADLSFFMEKIVPRIAKAISNKNLIKEWRYLFPEVDRSMVDFNIKNNIQFPYVLESDIRKLREIRRDTRNDKHFVQ